MIRQLVGDARVQLATLEPESIQACVTSPPYWGLRDYGTDPLVWGGDPEHSHEWGSPIPGDPRGGSGPNAKEAYGPDYGRQVPRGCNCQCGAWLGSLGLEPTHEAFISHLVEVFREVLRVLRPDGVLWMNLGDSYAGSGNGAHDYRDRTASKSLSLNPDKYQGQSPAALQRVGPQEHTEGSGRVPGYKAKDLMMIPARVAMALQADGWWLRSMIPWLKRNSMPESVTDRPASAVEYVFLLSKSARYFWDADAVRIAASPNTHDRRKDGGANPKTTHFNGSETLRPKNNGSMVEAINARVESRNRRNSDWFFESWQGLLADENADPLALVVNPAGYKGAHFATFPAKLVDPMVKASTRPGDTVLDPFGGSGTVGLVADRLGRNAVLVDLKPEYTDMAKERVTGEAPMFTEYVA